MRRASTTPTSPRPGRALLAALVVVALATALFATAPALASAVAPAGPTTEGVKAADAPIVAELGEKWPAAAEVFVNCPKADRIGIEPEPGEEEPIPYGFGYQCELRYLLEGKVVKGQDEVEEEPAHSGAYVLVNISDQWTAPVGWRLCGGGDEHPYVRGTVRGKVFLRGEECGYFSSGLVEAIEDQSYEERGRKLLTAAVPPTFSIGDEEEDEVGFQTERFLCHATTHRAAHGRFRHAVKCADPFGDGVKMTFESPPLHKEF
jgi:hypothetical protein